MKLPSILLLFTALMVLASPGCGGSSVQSDDTTPPTTPDSATDQHNQDDSVADSGPDSKNPAPFDWCMPDNPPDGDCYRSKRDPDSAQIALARAIVDKQIETHTPESMLWLWEDAVLMLGIVELYMVTNEPTYLGYYKAWMDYHIAKGYAITMSDTCVPAAIAVALYAQTGEEKYLTVIEDALYYLNEVAQRSKEGGISHLGTAPIITLWVDSLFMFGSVLIRWGELAQDALALDTYGTQFGIFSEVLQSDTGFFLHSAYWPDQEEGIYWGRGNGWVAAAGYQYLRVRQMRGESDEIVHMSVDALIQAALAAQDTDTGLWWTIMNRPGETYLETSAAALFAYAMARGYRYGFYDESILGPMWHAMDGITSRITTDEQGRPIITGVSGPTSAGFFDYYAAIEMVDDVPFGVGAVLFALIETSGLPPVP